VTQQHSEKLRPRGALRTPVCIRLEFAHWKALQDLRAFGLLRAADDHPDNDGLSDREHQP
jgi:hypothetical protein